ncbi:hypothetical protein G6F37_010173 [Rhizopus arrhizus]|nr:hypothetical protein G6F37_010173 [Rhizopus arrhizus]
MTRSFNQQDLADEWEEAYNTKVNTRSNNHFNAIFSDDEDDQKPLRFQHTFLKAGYIDPLLSSSTYHIHQADNALSTLKQVAMEEEGWKKALKHKSGVIVHMKNGLHKGDKTPIFKGEAVIHGFSPQAIFYVIGMRKLWDEQYEDGNLVENLNDTTSLTYEVMKSTTTSKSRDLALVEKIECTHNGAILFACTSVETPKIPKFSGRARANIKLQGWVLKPILGGPQPSTQVIFVIQENMKGWMPGFTKKTLARRPLVIAKVAEYLEKKAERMRSQTKQTTHTGISRRPSVMNYYQTNALPPPPPPRHFNNRPHNNPSSLTPSTTAIRREQSTPYNQQPQPKKHIAFAEQEIEKPKSTAPTKPANTVTSQSLYPLNRHPIQKVESVQLLKKLTASYDYWTLVKQVDGTKYYKFIAPLDDEESTRRIPFIRVDGVIHSPWTAEQLCSIIHCFGAREIWDTLFEKGEMVERFSQKDYLVRWHLRDNQLHPSLNTDISAITTIETDPVNGTVYTAAVSVNDSSIPADKTGDLIRAHMDLYGWMFRPNLDDQGRTVSVDTQFVCNLDLTHAVPKAHLERLLDASMQSIDNLQKYLNQYGCPPYIRRVAGKVIAESFDALTNEYRMVYTVKHQPSSSYRSRKRRDTNHWCTDIRIHKDMFPHGLDVHVLPDNLVRCEVLVKHQMIKIFTIDPSVDGKEVTLTLKPLLKDDDTFDYTTYKYNDTLFTSIKEKEEKKMTKISSTEQANQSSSEEALTKQVDEDIKVPKGYLLVPERQNNNLIVISDGLSFDGQQISIIFIAMVICYYMGKFTSCNSHSY